MALARATVFPGCPGPSVANLIRVTVLFGGFGGVVTRTSIVSLVATARLWPGRRGSWCFSLYSAKISAIDGRGELHIVENGRGAFRARDPRRELDVEGEGAAGTEHRVGCRCAAAIERAGVAAVRRIYDPFGRPAPAHVRQKAGLSVYRRALQLKAARTDALIFSIYRTHSS